MMNQLTCGVCGTEFSVPDYFNIARRLNGQSYVCPRGHQLAHPKKTLMDLEQYVRESLEAEKRVASLEKMVDETCDLFTKGQSARKSLSRQLSATRGVVTKLKKKLAAMKAERMAT